VFLLVAYLVTSHGFYWLCAGAIPFFVLADGWKKMCPECKEWWAAVHKGAQFLERWQEVKDVEREDVTRNKKGAVMHKTKRVEQVATQHQKHKHFYQCKHCNAAWARVVETTK
jgi:hypothetical protein